MSVTLKDVGSGFKRTAINQNFTDIEAEINNNLLNKDGSVSMESDLDMNSNDLINTGAIRSQALYLGGQIVTPEDLSLVDNLRVFGSVAEMKAFSPPALGMLLITQGYYTAGDGGGATYLVDTPQAVDGYGDHLLSSGNVALLQGDDINVKHYGAKGDAVLQKVAFNAATHSGGIATNYPYQVTELVSGTDDTLAIAAAVAKVQDNKTLFFPDGVYYVGQANTSFSSPLFNVADSDNIKLKADSAKIFAYQDITSQSLYMWGFFGCQGVQWDGLDLEIQAIGYPDEGANGFLTYASLISFQPLGGAEEFASIPSVTSKKQSKDCHVINSEFRCSHPDGGYPGTSGTFSGGGKIQGILYYGDFVAVASLGDEPPADLSIVEDGLVENCIFTETQGRVIWGWMTSGLTVRNNKFLNQCGGIRPIVRCLHHNDKLTVTNNVMECAQDWSTKFTFTHEPAIVASGNGGKYINTEVSVESNTIYVQKGSGVFFSNCVNSKVSDNTIRVYLGYDQGADSSTYALILMDYTNGGVTSSLSDIIISNNVLRGAATGIRAAGLTRALITNNNIAATGGSLADGNGITVSSLDDVVISGNILTGQQNIGIVLAHSAGWPGGGHALIEENYVQGGTTGITYFAGSTNFEMPVLKNNITKDCTTAGFRDSDISINNISIDNTAIATALTNATTQDLGGGAFGFSTIAAVIERGSNVNGEFVKYADGTLINFGVVSVPTDATLAAKGALWNTDWVATTFPLAFLNADDIAVSYRPKSSAGNYTVPTTIAATTNTTLQTSVLVTASSITATDYAYVAIGRWK